ncbi:DUF5641 domain-containing protein [Trichonephila clavipes]|nr:DUF5641 domain-containing protein [Trichonephila clavipes]
MDALKLRRTPLRTAFTKAVNHLQEVIENDLVDKNAVETAFEMLHAKSVKLKKIDEDILELMIETKCTQEAYNIEFEAIEVYTEKIIAWQVRVKNIMKTDALGQKDNNSLVTSSSSSLRLPKIQFQQFSGELTDWLRFHNQFKRIHEDESINEGDKFQYLIQATTPKSRARDIVESFPATPENYRKAFEYLRMRFGQEDVLIQVYVRELLKLVLKNTEIKKVNLSSLYDKIEAQLRALESLGVTKQKYAAMLFPLVESCLPAEILRAWERYVGYSSDESGKKDLDSLMKFLSIDVSSEDRIKLARNSFDSEKSNYKKKLGNLSTTATAADLFNNISGRYEVALPWVLDNKLLSSNRKLAENRLESTKRKLIATGKFEEYQDVLDLWLSGKIIEEVNEDKENFVHYLPHRPVIKENSTKLRKSVLVNTAKRIEYLGQLREQTQHHRKLRPLTVGEVVVVENSLKNRNLWSLARVIQLIPGKDGHVRVARVKTETGELVRPVQRLYNLELQEPEINLPKDLTDSVIRTRRGRKVISPKRLLTYAQNILCKSFVYCTFCFILTPAFCTNIVNLTVVFYMLCLSFFYSRKTQRWEDVVKAPESEGVVDPKSGERRLVSLLLSGSRGRKSAPKGDSSRCVWRKQTAMSVRDNI